MKTVQSRRGNKEHIVVEEENRHGWVTVLCGHTHFEPPFKEWDSFDDIPDDAVCKNCGDPMTKYHDK